MEGKVGGEVVVFEVCRQCREFFAMDEIEEGVRMVYNFRLFDPFKFVRGSSNQPVSRFRGGWTAGVCWTLWRDWLGFLRKSCLIDVRDFESCEFVETSEQFSFRLASQSQPQNSRRTGRFVVNGNPRIRLSLLFTTAPSYPKSVLRFAEPVARMKMSSHFAKSSFHD
jgi:hypothetical protein